MKWAKRLLMIVIVLGLILVVVYEGGRRLLASQFVASQVASRLAHVCGAPVKLDSVNLGVEDSTVEGLKLYPAGSEGAAGKPWMTVGDVKTDVTLWDALRGAAMPHELTLTGASITLHFDRKGQLLTQLPRPSGQHVAWPVVKVADSRLTIDQEGRPPLVINGINGTLQTKDADLVVSGTIEDPTWGEWTLQAHYDRSQAQGAATLVCPKLDLHQSKVETLPFISAFVWHAVNELEGDTRVEYQLSTNGPEHDLHYRLTLNPIRAHLHVPSIDLRGILIGGSVVVEPGVVYLRKVVGDTADGELYLSGDLDFRNEKRTRMRFDVTARHLSLLQLPRRWGLPQQISGYLSGQAKLVLTMANGHVQTDGEGRAVIKDAVVAGNPAEPIELTLRPSGEGFQFTSPSTSHSVPRSDILVGLVLLNTLLTAPQPAQPPQPSYLDIKLGLNNVDLKELADRLNLHLPFAVAGRLSFHLQVGLPINMPRELKAYRLKGDASLAWFALEGLRLEQVQARVNYADGVLVLEELKGQVPQATGPPAPGLKPAEGGSFAGSARAELFPAGDFTAQLKLERLPLNRLASVFPGGAENVAGLFTGSSSVRAPVNQLRDLKTWDASVTLQSQQLDVFGIQSKDLSARVSLKQGEFKVAELAGKIEGGLVTGAGELNLAPPYRYQANLDLENINLGMWQQLHPAFRPPIAVTGELGVKMQASGSLQPFAIHAQGHAGAQALVVDKVSLGSVNLDWDTDRHRLTLSRINAALYQGKLTGEATVPLQPAAPGALDVSFQNLNLSQLARSLPPLPVRFEGVASGTIKATSPAIPQKQRTWATEVKMRSRQLTIQGIPAEAVTGSVTTTTQSAKYHFQGETLGGTFDVEGTMPLGKPSGPAPPEAKPPEGSEGRLRFSDLQLDRVWAFLSLEKVLAPLQGSIDLIVNYNHEPGGFPAGRGRFWINDLRWQDLPFLDDAIPGWLELSQERLRLGFRVIGLGGAATFRAAANLHDLARSWFALQLEQVDLARLLAPWPGWLAWFRGRASLDLRGSFGPPWSGSGTLSLAGATIYGLAVSEAHLPIELSYSPTDRLGQLSFNGSTLRFPTGWATGNAELTWGIYNRLKGQLRFSGIDLRHLFNDSKLTHYASGQMAGTLDFGGENIHSFADVTAALQANLHHTKALQWPILRQLTPFLTGLSSATVFDEGDMRAHLARGVVRIERLALQAPLVGLFLEGTITVPSGRLNLSATILAQLLRLQITGTVHSPVIKVQPF